MYERMLDKTHQPTEVEFLEHCGAAKELFTELDRFMIGEMHTSALLRFPYGNKYGWGYKYAVKSKHICDVFAETDAFTVMVRMDNSQFERVYPVLQTCSQKIIDSKYSCGSGGWIHYRVLTAEQLNDIKLIISEKLR